MASVKWSAAAVGTALILLAFLAAIAGPTTTSGSVHFGWLSLAPAAMAIILAFTTRQVVVALLAGTVAGGVVYGFGSAVPGAGIEGFPWDRLNFIDAFLLPSVGSIDYAIILVVYLWGLGGLIGLWTRTGGARHFAQTMGRRLVKGPRSARLFAWTMGVVFHQGGTISTVLAGTTVRPMLDRHRISKEEAAYLVDSTASPVATIVPFNVFPFVAGAAVAGTIPFFTTADGTPDVDKAVRFFFEAIPWNLYAWLAVLSTFLLAAGWLPGIAGIGRARRRVDDGGPLVRPGSTPLSPKELSDVRVPDGYRPGMIDFALPLGFLLAIAIGPFLIQTMLGNERELYVVEAFVAALFIAMGVAMSKGMAGRDVMDGFLSGVKGVSLAAIVLALAVTMKGVAVALGTGPFVAGLLGDLPPALLPALLLVAGMVVAFSTGSSFGTFAVLFPVAMPLADALAPGNVTFLAMSFGAVLSGSVFGDQASPISDTTVLSSLAVGCDLMDHVTTQLPYAATAAGLAAVGFLVAGSIVV